MLADVPRFHRLARALLQNTRGDDPTWGEFLTRGRFSPYFIDHFAVPLVACVWSSGDADARAYPARQLFEFLDHHGMLTITGSPPGARLSEGPRPTSNGSPPACPTSGRGLAVTSLTRHGDGVAVRPPPTTP